MKRRIFGICFLILLFLTTSFAQKKPSWLGQIEEKIEQDSLNPVITIQNFENDGNSFRYIAFLLIKTSQKGTVVKGQRAFIEIRKWAYGKEPEKVFKMDVDAFIFSISRRSENTTETGRLSIGNEGFFWDLEKYSKVMFRKNDIFVNIVVSEELIPQRSYREWATALAQNINDRLP